MTGLLTSAQREFLRGESSPENPTQYRRNIRHRTRKRFDEIEMDLRLLEEHGESEIREEFFARFNRERFVEDEIDELRSEVAQLRTALDALTHPDADVDPDTLGTDVEADDDVGDDENGEEPKG